MVDLVYIKREIKQLLNTYHLLNILFALAFVLTKNISFICINLFGEDKCGFNAREHEFLVFFGVIVLWKGRKASTMLHYLANVYFFSKIVNGILFFMVGPLYGIVYSVAVIVFVILCPEPILSDPSSIVFFQGEGLHNELKKDKAVVWVIEFFSTWSAECKYMAPVFAKLSDRYGLPNLRFGKLDVGRYPKEGERFRISTHPMSKQLPSIAIFRNGIQSNRRPAVGSNQRVVPFVFSEENCIMELNLNEIQKECKAKLKKYEKSKNL